jgi:hypothetical protein
MIMSSLRPQPELPNEVSAETLYVKRLKEAIAASPFDEDEGARHCVTFKLGRDRHRAIVAALVRHGMTLTDLLTYHIDQILPVLQKAISIEVPGYKQDLRTKLARSRRQAYSPYRPIG